MVRSDAGAMADQQKNIKIQDRAEFMKDTKICTFRLDDITADMDWNRFNRICGIFDKYQVKPLLGVVPDCRDESLHMQEQNQGFWEILRSLQEKGYSMAQHGYHHVYETKDSGILRLNPFSEFAGVPYEKQEEKIRKGKQILQKEGIYVTIFMAPGHTYDCNTLRALKKNGFTHVTDGYANQIYCSGSLTFIPSRQSRPGLQKGIDTICLHVNSMKDADFDDLEQFIRKNRAAVADYKDLLAEKGNNRDLGILLEEKKNLCTRRLKRFVSTNIVLHEYLQETATDSRKSSTVKRILGLPHLAWELLGSRWKQ